LVLGFLGSTCGAQSVIHLLKRTLKMQYICRIALKDMRL
jgi:hypothetical protein